MTETIIKSLGQHGDGIAEVEGERVFVPFTLPGERVEIAREGERGTLLSILEPSAGRAEPISPYFGACGGCQLQHLGHEAYAAFKRGLVVLALEHAGVAAEVAPLIDATGAGRRRATLHVRKSGAGYMRARSHEVLDIDACPILVPVLSRNAPRTARALQPLAGDSDVSFTATDTGLDLSVKSERKLKPVQLAEFARTHKLARLTFTSVEAKLLGEAGAGAAPLARTMQQAAILLANEMVGGAERLREDALDYTKMRMQFGRSIASFQTTKNKAADMLADVEMAKSAAYYAAAALDEGDEELPALASLAKACAAEAYLQTAIHAVQMHGGIGFTWDNDTHLWFKRAKSSEVLFGDANQHRELMMQHWKH